MFVFSFCNCITSLCNCITSLCLSLGFLSKTLLAGQVRVRRVIHVFQLKYSKYIYDSVLVYNFWLSFGLVIWFTLFAFYIYSYCIHALNKGNKNPYFQPSKYNLEVRLTYFVMLPNLDIYINMSCCKKCTLICHLTT